MKSVEDLDEFKLAHQLALKTYSTTKAFPREDGLERIKDEIRQPWPTAISRSEQKSMLFRLSGSLPHCRNAPRLKYWAASCSGLGHLWERNTARPQEPNPTPISLVKLKGRSRSWKNLSTGWNCSANPDFFRQTDWPR